MEIRQTQSNKERFMSFIKTTHDISITVAPMFLDEESAPDVSQYCWSYYVIIRNLGEEVVKLQGRYWRIVDGNGLVSEVEGEGVIGQFPELAPGAEFQYNSWVPLGAPSGIMEGYYIFSVEEGARKGQSLQVTIPTFSLDSPEQKLQAN
jgi:ApaG protein